MKTLNKANVDVKSLDDNGYRSFDRKIYLWDELATKEFMKELTAEELNEMESLLNNRYYYGDNRRYVSHFDYTFESEDAVSILYDYLRLIIIDCICYNELDNFRFYTQQLNKILDDGA